MKKAYHGNSKKGGIYQIKNLINSKVYIGSAKCFQVRAAQHENRLSRGKHHNKHLLASWQKHGTENFLFEILEVVEGTTKQRRIIEQKHINKIIKEGKWSTCYNNKKKTIKRDKKYWSSKPEETKKKIGIASKKAWTSKRRKETSERSKKLWKNPEYRERMYLLRKGQKRSEETKRKLREKKLGEKNPMWGGNFSEEHLRKMSLVRKGKPLGPKTEETKRKISQNRKGKGCYPCTPEKKKKLSKANKGTKPSPLSIKRTKEVNSKIYNVVLLNPNGKEFFLEINAAEFCRTNNLSIVGINKLLNKKIQHHRGWTLP